MIPSIEKINWRTFENIFNQDVLLHVFRKNILGYATIWHRKCFRINVNKAGKFGGFEKVFQAPESRNIA